MYSVVSLSLTYKISLNEYKYLHLPSKFFIVKFSFSSFSKEMYLKGCVNFRFFHCWFL